MGVDTADPAIVTAPAVEFPAAPRTLPLRFVGSGSEYFRIWIVNLLLTVVTLGLYYPYAKVRRLKYFHGATELGRQPFGYHAEPRSMLRGYLLAFAMVAGYSVAGNFSPVAGWVAFVLIALLWPAPWRSSMRFHFANTSWRGLRFRFEGTAGGAYAALAVPIGLALAVASTPLGEELFPSGESSAWAMAAGVASLAAVAALPWMLWRLHHYRQANLALGAEQAAYRVRTGSYYGLLIRTALVSLVPIAALGVLAGGLVLLVIREGPGWPGLEFDWLLVPLGVLGYLTMLAVTGGYYTARMQALMWGGTVTPHLRFESRLPARRLIGLWLANGLLIVLTLGLYVPFAQVATARLRLESMTVTSTLPLDALTTRAGATQEAAAGDAAGDLLGLDVGL